MLSGAQRCCSGEPVAVGGGSGVPCLGDAAAWAVFGGTPQWCSELHQELGPVAAFCLFSFAEAAF